MSLSSRVERAQQQQQGQAEGSAPAAVPSSPDSPLVPTVPPPPASPRALRRTPTAATAARKDLLRDIRRRLQDEVVNAFNAQFDTSDPDVRDRVGAIVDRVMAQYGFALTRDERLTLIGEVVDDLVGFGPLEPFLRDESVTEIMVNGSRQVYIERGGKIVPVESQFLGDDHVLRIIDRIITPMGRRIDESSPRVDARLPDGSRVNAIIPPLSLVGPVITVRKFAAKPFTVEDLVRFGTATPEMFDFLRACVEAKLNVFVSGGTGSGKTTTLNVLSSFIPNDERIVTIEDAAELQLRQEHVVTLEARPPNLEGEGEITIRSLLRHALHMRPDRIIVGECRSGEALDMLGAMTTGHDGSLSTGHANTPADMLRRLETMVLMTGYEMPLRAIREQISSAVDLIVHQARLQDGSRKIVNITEVYGIEDDEVLTADIFAFEQTGIVDGRVEGYLRPTGFRPTFMPQFQANGVRLPADEFGIPPEDPSKPSKVRHVKSRRGVAGVAQSLDPGLVLGNGRTVAAGGMVYVSSVGPIDPATGLVVLGGVKEHARQCLRNLQERLEAAGSSLGKVVWANWSLRDPSEYDAFNDEWARWFPGDAPVGQETIMAPLHRRAGFKVALAVIAEG